jgi:hypothetical protein
MTRSHITLLFALVLTIAGALSACTAQDNANTQSGEEQTGCAPVCATAVPTKGVTSSGPTTQMADVPIYPGATDVNEHCQDDVPTACVYRFTTRDTDEQVLRFYKETLAHASWQVMDESSASQPSGIVASGVRFFWIGGNDSVPVRRYLSVGTDSVPDSPQTAVVLLFEPWPDPNRPPLYPGATRVHVTREAIPDSTRSDLVTEYSVRASASDIKGFYERTMPQYGWQRGAHVDYNYYRRTANDGLLQSYVNIVVGAQDAEGSTTVQVRVGGNDFNLSLPHGN